jgi:hypothetical protein
MLNWLTTVPKPIREDDKNSIILGQLRRKSSPYLGLGPKVKPLASSSQTVSPGKWRPRVENAHSSCRRINGMVARMTSQRNYHNVRYHIILLLKIQLYQHKADKIECSLIIGNYHKCCTTIQIVYYKIFVQKSNPTEMYPTYLT